MMTGDGLLELRRRTTLVRVINPRGARHWGAASRHQTCMQQVRLDPNHDAVMRISGKARGGGPILTVGIGATSTTGSRHLGSSTRQCAEKPARAPNSSVVMLVPVPLLGCWT